MTLKLNWIPRTTERLGALVKETNAFLSMYTLAKTSISSQPEMF